VTCPIAPYADDLAPRLDLKNRSPSASATAPFANVGPVADICGAACPRVGPGCARDEFGTWGTDLSRTRSAVAMVAPALADRRQATRWSSWSPVRRLHETNGPRDLLFSKTTLR